MAIVGRTKYTRAREISRRRDAKGAPKIASRLLGLSRARVYFVRPTIAIAKIRDYSQSTGPPQRVATIRHCCLLIVLRKASKGFIDLVYIHLLSFLLSRNTCLSKLTCSCALSTFNQSLLDSCFVSIRLKLIILMFISISFTHLCFLKALRESQINMKSQSLHPLWQLS